MTMARKEYFADFTIKVFKLEKITRAEVAVVDDALSYEIYKITRKDDLYWPSVF